jgi:cbb3-type cytochrome oxidase subunit 3
MSSGFLRAIVVVVLGVVLIVALTAWLYWPGKRRAPGDEPDETNGSG